MTASITIGIVDYGVGNLASVRQALMALGYRCRVSMDAEILVRCDLLILPGVGAFPAAMRALHERGMVDGLREVARQGKPIIGICLGMQLLADSSTELALTPGLGFIPGEVRGLQDARWHIGWNTVEAVGTQGFCRSVDGDAFYFNHQYVFYAPSEYIAAVSRLTPTSAPFTVAVQRGNVVGIQCHPEKSQEAGKRLLRSVIMQLTSNHQSVTSAMELQAC